MRSYNDVRPLTATMKAVVEEKHRLREEENQNMHCEASCVHVRSYGARVPHHS